jgi:hypothetical protein
VPSLTSRQGQLHVAGAAAAAGTLQFAVLKHLQQGSQQLTAVRQRQGDDATCTQCNCLLLHMVEGLSMSCLSAARKSCQWFVLLCLMPHR